MHLQRTRGKGLTSHPQDKRSVIRCAVLKEQVEHFSGIRPVKLQADLQSVSAPECSKVTAPGLYCSHLWWKPCLEISCKVARRVVLISKCVIWKKTDCLLTEPISL